MRIPPITVILGVAGVAPDERPLARKVGKWFEAPMLVLAAWLAVDWYLDVKRIYPPGVAQLTNFAVWGFFLAETLTLTALVERKGRYLLTNWLNLVIIVASASVIWGEASYAGILRSLRLVVIFPLLIGISPTLRKLLARNHFGLTLLVAFFVVALAGLFMAGLDPGIESVWDGLWWAWVTVSTVGYGDVVPSSPAGRIFGSVLILLGVGLFSLVTANISAYFVSQEEEKVKEEEARLRQEQQATREQMEYLERRLRRVETLLASIDRRLGEKPRRPRRAERSGGRFPPRGRDA